jgi:activator of HSP90 ATPase
MRGKTVRQSISLQASPHELYELLMNPITHSELVCADVIISREKGGEFSIRASGVTGSTAESDPDRKIVLYWRSEERDWPQDHFSKVTFQFQAVDEGTLLTFTQSGVPVQHIEAVTRAWNTYYWQPMKALLSHRRHNP